MIDSSMTIGEILKANPNAPKALERYGLACAQCHLNTMETLEEGAKAHGLSDEEIGKMVGNLSK